MIYTFTGTFYFLVSYRKERKKDTFFSKQERKQHAELLSMEAGCWNSKSSLCVQKSKSCKLFECSKLYSIQMIGGIVIEFDMDCSSV